jgi:hypothetical protein
VLQPAAGLGDDVEEEIFLVRQRAPEGALRLDDLLQVARGHGAVEDAGFPLVDEVMRLPVHAELVDSRVPEQDRRVHQRVVVGRQVAVRRAAGLDGQARHRPAPPVAGTSVTSCGRVTRSASVR